MIFHEEERVTTAPLHTYAESHYDNVLRLLYSDGECYEVTYYSEGESGDFDEEPIDEYRAIYFDITRILNDGTRRYNDYLTVTYKSFPAVITDCSSGKEIYNEQREPQWATD